MTDNILAPLTFTEAEIGLFIRDRRCAICRSHFIPFYQGNGEYYAECPNCGKVTQHIHTSRVRIDQLNSDEAFAARDLRKKKPKRSSDEILTELGF